MNLFCFRAPSFLPATAHVRGAAAAAVALFGLLVFAPSATAALKIWNGDGDGTTSSAANNWHGRTVPPAGDDIEFSVNVPQTGIITVNVDSVQTIGSLYFNRVTQNDGDSYVFTNQTLRITPSGRWSSRDPCVLTSTVQIHCDLLMKDDVTVEVSGGATWPLRIAGTIDDGGNDCRLAFNVQPNTQTYLKGNNSFSGGFALVGTKGRLFLGHANPLGTGSLVAGGVLDGAAASGSLSGG